MITYHLSNRQLKELANGKTLRIAIPYPDAGIPGAHIHHDGSGEASEERLSEWVECVLNCGDVEHDIVYAGVETVPCNPLRRDSGLGKLLGAVVSTHQPEWTVRVLCVVVELAARRAPRSKYPTQWPAKLTLSSGQTLPE